MRKTSLRRTKSFFSLLNLKSSAASAQSAYSSPSSATSTTNLYSFSASTETLVPTSSEVSPSTLPTSASQHPTPVEGTTTRRTPTESTTGVVYLGQALPVDYRKIGFAGALAGAAGVFII